MRFLVDQDDSKNRFVDIGDGFYSSKIILGSVSSTRKQEVSVSMVAGVLRIYGLADFWKVDCIAVRISTNGMVSPEY